MYCTCTNLYLRCTVLLYVQEVLTNLYSKLLHKMDQDFLDMLCEIHFCDVNLEFFRILIRLWIRCRTNCRAKSGKICPRSRDPLYIGSYYIKWVKTSYIVGLSILLTLCAILIWFISYLIPNFLLSLIGFMYHELVYA